MLNCRRYDDLQKRDEWRFDGAPQTRHNVASVVHAAVGLLVDSFVARTAWTLGQFEAVRLQRRPISLSDTSN